MTRRSLHLAERLEQRTGIWLFASSHSGHHWAKLAAGIAWDGDGSSWLLSAGVQRFAVGIGWVSKERRRTCATSLGTDVLSWIDEHLNVPLTQVQRDVLLKAYSRAAGR